MKRNTATQSAIVTQSNTVSVLAQYAGILSVAQAHLEAKAVEDEKSLPDSVGVRNALFNSLSLWFLANGVSPGDKLEKAEKKILRERHETFRTAVRTEANIVVSINGQSGQVVKMGRARLVGSDIFGLPKWEETSCSVRTELSISRLEAFAKDSNEAMRKGIEARKASQAS